MLITLHSLETLSFNGGRGCKYRVEVGIWRILITRLSLDRRGWALLSSPLNHKPYTEIVVANSEVEVSSPLGENAQLSLETHNINGGRGCEFRGNAYSQITPLSLERRGWALLSSP
jgi:hypothetical protein